LIEVDLKQLENRKWLHFAICLW